MNSRERKNSKLSYKIKDTIHKIVDRFYLFLFYAGLNASSPAALFTLIFTISTLLWGIFSYIKDPAFQINIHNLFWDKTNLLVIITYIMFLIIIVYFVIPIMFPRVKQAQIIVEAYGNNPRIILYVAKEIKKWINDSFVEREGTLKEIKECIKHSNNNELSKLAKELQNKTSKKNKKKIEEDGRYLNILIKGVSASYRIPQESFEEFICTKIDINQKIVDEIIYSYDQMYHDIQVFTNTKGSEADKYRKKIEETIEDICKKEQNLKNQIIWLEELDKKREAIPKLIEILNEFSTGRALSLLSNLLENAENSKDLEWLIRFANSRKGIKISELLGLTLDNENSIKWNGKQISDQLDDEKEFFHEFNGLREDALVSLWDNFNKWYKEEGILNLSEPIAIGLTYGYSAVLKKILKGICEDVKNENKGKDNSIKGLRILLIRTDDTVGDEEILKAELLANYKDDGLICQIIPLGDIKTTIEEKKIQIKSIFVGIESINKGGDIIHPRGGSGIIKKIKEIDSEIKVYAFGESYKIRDFTEEDIDYSKLSYFQHKNIDYVVTDHGVHKRDGESWKIGNKSKGDLSCCMDLWENTIEKYQKKSKTI